MKKMYALLLPLFVATTSLAFAGQEGSGANFCVLSIPCNEEENCSTKAIYRLLDELNHPELLDPSIPGAFHPLPVYTHGFHYFNLTDTAAGSIALEKIKNLAHLNPVLSGRLEQAFTRFAYVSTIPEFFSRSFRGDYRSIYPCTPQSALGAFVSWHNGQMILSLSAWNVLNLQSQVILLIHETLRQISFTAGLPGLTDEHGLQHITMLILNGDIERIRQHTFFRWPNY